jgi:hypothetical protein
MNLPTRGSPKQIPMLCSFQETGVCEPCFVEDLLLFQPVGLFFFLIHYSMPWNIILSIKLPA